jgi:hypothetical protein
MAHREVIATRTGRYGTRMLTAGEPVLVSGPMAREMIALGRARPADVRDIATQVFSAAVPKIISAVAAKSAEKTSALGDARKAYKEKFGKLPGPKWSVEEIQAKIAAA